MVSLAEQIVLTPFHCLSAVHAEMIASIVAPPCLPALRVCVPRVEWASDWSVCACLLAPAVYLSVYTLCAFFTVLPS